VYELSEDPPSTFLLGNIPQSNKAALLDIFLKCHRGDAITGTDVWIDAPIPSHFIANKIG
jgi:hypothetical protein